jgi:hypothetical protein
MASAPQPIDMTPEDDSIETMTREERLQLIDVQARKFLGMSGEEFMRRYRAGELESPCRLDVAGIAILLPLAEL